MNEYIKTTILTFMPVYLELYNILFDSGIVPEDWLVGLVKPIYKGKGDISHPEYYRPIKLLSCLGKPFTSILCKCFDAFVDELELISEAQT